MGGVVPSLNAQVPQFDNWNFDQATYPGFCQPNWFPDMESCGVTGVDWWMWKEFSAINDPDNPPVDVKAGLFFNPQGCNTGNSLFIAEDPTANNMQPLVATRNPIYNKQNYPAKILLSLQERPELADLGSFASYLKVFGSNQKDITEPGASATEIGISKIIPATADCNDLEIWLDGSAKNFKYLGFALSGGQINKATTPAYIDNVQMKKFFDFNFFVGCDGLCFHFHNGWTPSGAEWPWFVPSDYTVEVFLNGVPIYEVPYSSDFGTRLVDLCFPYAEYSQYYIDGTNEFSIQMSSDIHDQTWIDVVKETFEFSAMQNIVIPSGNTTWTLNNVPNNGKLNSLTLLDGATLTINPDVTLNFPQDGELDINPGGRFNNEGTLTSCNDFWQGVRVLGSASKKGLFGGYPHSLIEKAKIGVMNCDSDTDNRGGRIHTYNAIFKNNEIAVQMWGKGGAIDVPSTTSDKSTFKYTTFVVDEEMPTSLTFESFVDLRFINLSKTSSLRANHFIVDESMKKPPIPNFGIKSFVSIFQANGNDFYRLQTGISAYGNYYYGNSQSYITSYNKFEDCMTGIHNRSMFYGYMKKNTFTLGKVPENYQDANTNEQDAQVGIVMASGIGGFFMEKNTFKRKPGNQLFTIGSHCFNMGTHYYEIRDNIYKNLTAGNTSKWVNGKKKIISPGSTNDGLIYLCNQNSGNHDDFYVDNLSIIHPIQRHFGINQFDAVLNTFSYSSEDAGWDFGNYGTTEVKYYYDPSYQNGTPRDGQNGQISHIIGVSRVIRATNNHCLIKKGPMIGKGEVPKAEIEANRKKYFNAHKEYLNAHLDLIKADLKQNEVLAKVKRRQTEKYKRVADEAAFNGYLYAVLDSTGQSTDSIPLWLGRMERLEADLALSSWYRQHGQNEKAKGLLDELQQKYELSEKSTEELERFVKTLDIIGNQPLTKLDENSLKQLHWLAIDDGSLSSAFAKNVLSMYGEYYPPIFVDILPNNEKTNNLTGGTSNSKISITPNPTSAYVNLDWSMLDVQDAPVKIVLRDKMGLLLLEIEVPNGQYSKEISLEKYQDGVIYYHLMSNDIELDSGQIILNK